MAIKLPFADIGRDSSRREKRRQATNQSFTELFQNPEAHGASLLLGALRIIPFEELIAYHPHTVRLELQDELKVKEIDDDLMSRLFASLTILTTDLFYRNVQSFIEICNVLSGTEPLPGFFDPADSFEMAVAIAQAGIIDPLDGSDDMDFSEEVRGYMGIQLDEEGFISPPRILEMAIMPPKPQPVEVTDDAELLEAVMVADADRHADIETAVAIMLDEIREQTAFLD